MKTNLISQKPMVSVLAYSTGVLALMLFTEMAFAGGGGSGGGVGAVAKTVTSNLVSIANLIGAAAYVSGIAFALTGLMKFKAHKDNPQQTPLSQPIVLIMIAAGLIFLPSMIGAAGGTLFEGGKAGSAKGEGFEDVAK
jgi:intracellular multiplication protein IcmD